MGEDKQNVPIKKVIFEYADGQKKILTGNQLQKWVEFNKHVALVARTHGANPNWGEIVWKDEE